MKEHYFHVVVFEIFEIVLWCGLWVVALSVKRCRMNVERVFNLLRGFAPIKNFDISFSFLRKPVEHCWARKNLALFRSTTLNMTRWLNWSFLTGWLTSNKECQQSRGVLEVIQYLGFTVFLNNWAKVYQWCNRLKFVFIVLFTCLCVPQSCNIAFFVIKRVTKKWSQLGLSLPRLNHKTKGNACRHWDFFGQLSH